METKTLQLNVKQQNNLFYTFPPLIFTWKLLIKYIRTFPNTNTIDIVCHFVSSKNTFQFMDSERVKSLVLCCKDPYLFKKLVPRTLIFAAFHCYVQFASDTQGYYGALKNSVSIHKLSEIYIKKIAINNLCEQLLSSRLISKDLSVTLEQT